MQHDEAKNARRSSGHGGGAWERSEGSDDATRLAGEWVARCDRGLSPREEAEFATWRAEPRNAAELARMQSTWGKLDRLDRDPALNTLADAVLARAQQRRRRRSVARMVTFASAAAAAVACGFLGWRQIAPPPRAIVQLPKENYRVLASTVQRTTLPDGSEAELNGDSRIAVDYSDTARRVTLLSGEAHFVVAKNPERPFYVTAGPVTVRAVGTAFNVRLAVEKIEVLVTEGKVQLQHEEGGDVPAEASAGAAALVVGQRAVISRTAAAKRKPEVAVDEMGRAEIEDELGWQSTRLVFNNTPLDEVIEGFNRYNRQRLTLGDPRLKQRSLTGVFRADNLEGFIRLLRASVDVKAEAREDGETVLLPAR